MDKNIRWDDLRIAYQVAFSGSLSRAGEALDINHSTALRAINRLEAALGLKLFIRHQRGYQLTDAGKLMEERMRPIEGDMHRLCNTLSTLESSPSGTLRISTVTDFSPFFAPLLHAFRQEHPQIRVQIVATDEVLSLAKGDVHASIRIGGEPQGPDLIARPLMRMSLGFYASKGYVELHGLPKSLADINRHHWVLPIGEKDKITAIRQILDNVDSQNIVFQSNSFTDIESAIRAGMGIGALSHSRSQVSGDTEFVEVDLDITMDSSQIWFVYHKDMRESARVRALQAFLQRHTDT